MLHYTLVHRQVTVKTPQLDLAEHVALHRHITVKTPQLGSHCSWRYNTHLLGNLSSSPVSSPSASLWRLLLVPVSVLFQEVNIKREATMPSSHYNWFSYRHLARSPVHVIHKAFLYIFVVFTTSVNYSIWINSLFLCKRLNYSIWINSLFLCKRLNYSIWINSLLLYSRLNYFIWINSLLLYSRLNYSIWINSLFLCNRLNYSIWINSLFLCNRLNCSIWINSLFLCNRLNYSIWINSLLLCWTTPFE